MYRRRRSLTAFLIKVLFFAGLLFLAAGAVDRSIRPVLMNMAQAKVVQLANDSVYGAVRKEITEKSLNYEDVVMLHKDDTGRVVMLQTNTVMVNQIAAGVALSVENALKDLEHQSFGIPFGQVFGLHIFALWGPDFKVSVVPVGSVKVTVQGKFEEAGINQTRHTIFLVAETTVKVVVPLNSAEVRLSSNVPVADSILLGTVPDVCVNFPGGILGGQ